jgi:hypothetical protein
MKQHPDRQPRRAITVQRRDDDNGQDNQDFEGNGIDVVLQSESNAKGAKVLAKNAKVLVYLIVPLRPFGKASASLWESLCVLCG